MIASRLSELDIQKRLVEKYEAVSGEKFYQLYQNYWNGIILESAPDERDSFILDCGSGIGKISGTLCGTYNNVWALDLSSDMLKIACKDNKKIKPIVGDAQNSSFNDESFDMVISKGLLHHLREPEKAIKEMSRVLKKGGSLVISEPCRDCGIWRKLGLVYVKLSKNFSVHHRLFYSGELKEMLRRNGFEIQKSRYLGFIAFPLCGIAHQFPLMKFIPFNAFLAGVLIKLDEKCLKIPLIKELHWHIVIYSRKA